MRWLRRVARAVVAVMAASMLGLAAANASTVPVTARHVHVQPEGLPSLDVYIEDVGRGRPVVLLHGLGGSGYLWRHIVADLARSHRVITIDMMGFGRSDKPLHGHYAPADHARVVAATLRALDLKNVALAGHSLGGLVALFVAMDADKELARRVTSLMLFSAPALPQPVNGAVRFLSQPVLPYLALSLLPPDMVARIGLLSGASRMGHITDTDISFYADPLRGLGGAHAIIQSARQIAPEDPRPILERYKAIRQPILVSGCREDRTVPISTAVALSRYLRNARLAILENCDHLPMEQNPAAVIKAMRRFLAR